MSQRTLSTMKAPTIPGTRRAHKPHRGRAVSRTVVLIEASVADNIRDQCGGGRPARCARSSLPWRDAVLQRRRSCRRSVRRLTPWATTATVATVAAVRATGAGPITAARRIRRLAKGMSIPPATAVVCSGTRPHRVSVYPASSSSSSSASIAASNAWIGMRPLATSCPPE
jgi:hypothetical protein